MTAGPPHRAGPPRPGPAVLLSVAVLVASLTPGSSAAQQRCRYTVLDPTRGYSQSTQTASGDFVHYFSGGIDYQCPDGARILADSAAIFQGENLAQLFGNVRFTDPQTELVANRADYYANARQLQAWDDVRLFDRINGAVISGEELVLYRATPSRPMDRMIISGGTPHATVYLTDGGLESVVPYEVDADRFTLEGRRFFRAGGNVVVDRATLHAVGDSLDFDQDLGIMSVFENARVQDASFDLTARTVTVLTPKGTVEEVLAREEAELVGDGVFLEAPAVRMFVEQNQVERLVALRWIPPVPDSATLAARETAAVPPDSAGASGVGEASAPPEEDPPGDPVEALLPRPSAIAEDFHLWADSIDVRSPGQVLDRVIAVGAARGQTISPADSAAEESLPTVAQDDWMEGDTIVVAFALPDSTGPMPADSSGPRPELRSITSIGSARSLYKVPPADSVEAALPGAKPALHYVTADRIRIHLREGEVTRMEVEGQTSGFHFEPTRSTTPDTTVTGSEGSSGRPARQGPGHDRLEARQGGPPSPLRRSIRVPDPTHSRRQQ